MEECHLVGSGRIVRGAVATAAALSTITSRMAALCYIFHSYKSPSGPRQARVTSQKQSGFGAACAQCQLAGENYQGKGARSLIAHLQVPSRFRSLLAVGWLGERRDGRRPDQVEPTAWLFRDCWSHCPLKSLVGRPTHHCINEARSGFQYVMRVVVWAQWVQCVVLFGCVQLCIACCAVCCGS
jgi:hypothetical protein